MTPFEQMRLDYMRRTFPMVGYWRMQKAIKFGAAALTMPIKILQSALKK